MGWREHISDRRRCRRGRFGQQRFGIAHQGAQCHQTIFRLDFSGRAVGSLQCTVRSGRGEVVEIDRLKQVFFGTARAIDYQLTGLLRISYQNLPGPARHSDTGLPLLAGNRRQRIARVCCCRTGASRDPDQVFTESRLEFGPEDSECLIDVALLQRHFAAVLEERLGQAIQEYDCQSFCRATPIRKFRICQEHYQKLTF